MNDWVIGVDLGGTKIEVGLVSPDNHIVGRRRIPTQSYEGSRVLVDRIARQVEELAALLPAGETIRALGICCPGPVDHETGTLVDPPNLDHKLHNAPLRLMLSERLSIPVCLEHDAKATAMGEFHFGAGQGEKTMIFVIVGTGVGAAIIDNGQIVRGKYNSAGEIGHVTLDRYGDECSCGSRGCVETYLSGPGLVRRYKKALEQQLGHPVEEVFSGEMVAKLAGQSDPLAGRIITEAGEALGLAVANMAMLLNVDLFVVGGGVARLGDLLLEPARHMISKYTYRSVGCGVQLLTTELGNDGSILGCAWLAREAAVEYAKASLEKILAAAEPQPAAALLMPAAVRPELETAAEVALLEKVEGMVTDIQRFSVHDGPGIRTNVFLKGCPLRCAWCSNPETQRPHAELAFSAKRCIRCGQFEDICGESWGIGGQTAAAREKFGKRTDLCPTGGMTWLGMRRSAGDVMAEIMRDQPFYQGKGGLTLTGGEPTFQPRMAEALLRLARVHGLSTVMETTGNTRGQVLERLMPYLDLLLFDVKHIDPQMHKTYTGMDNTLILSNLIKLSEQGAPVEVRVPLIPGFNADEASLGAIADFVARQDGLSRSVTLLPYHTYGRPKYASLGREYPWEGQPLLTDAQIHGLVGVAEAHGLHVTVGG